MDEAEKQNKKAESQGGIWGILGLLAVAAIFNLPQLQTIGETQWFSIGIRALISGILLYCAFFGDAAAKIPVPGKLVMLLGMPVPWLTYLPEKLSVIILSALFLVQGILLAVSQIKRDDSFSPLYAAVLTLLFLFELSKPIHFQNPLSSNRYWQLAIIGGVSVGAIFAVLLGMKIVKMKDNRVSERITFVLLAALISGAAIWLSAYTLNFALDRSEPTIYSAEITDKHISPTKTAMDFSMTIESPNEKMQIYVSKAEYFEKEIGDSIEIRIYKGAFGDSYYIFKE